MWIDQIDKKLIHGLQYTENENNDIADEIHDQTQHQYNNRHQAVKQSDIRHNMHSEKSADANQYNKQTK